MVARQIELADLLMQINRMSTDEEISRVGALKNEFYQYATDDETQAVKKAVQLRFRQLREEFEQESTENLKVLTELGFTVDTREWLTIKRYAEKYNLDTHVVTNWIRRGNIPADCIIELAEFNNIRLVKDQPY